MTVQTFTADTLHTGFNFAGAAMSLVDAFRGRLAARRRYQSVKAELLDYSLEQLAELGISDADIESVAVDAARE